MADPRVPRFELHIRPLMRWIDRHNMRSLDAASSIDLWDYDSVRGKATKIITRLGHGMPPETHGGPWPQEWIDLFVRWKNAGFPRLELATASEFKIERDGVGFITIRVSGSVPQSGYQIWLDSEQRVGLPNLYVVYQEGPDSPAGPTDSFVIEEFLPEPGPDVTSFTIRDSAGEHVVAISPLAPAPVA